MIVDSHQHLGRSMFSGVVTTERDLLEAMDRHGVDVALVMPQPTLEDIRAVHDQIAQAVQRNPGKLFGMASINPWWPEAEYQAEARRTVRDLGFVALKLHPRGHNLASNHPEADKVFRAALELGVPLIVHLTNLLVALTKYRALGLNAEALDAILGGTARTLFGLPA
jgi:predicted TIM-barrel fold metal-dependent hydrolase